MILANEKVCQYLKTPPLLCKEGWSFCFTFRHLVRVRINFLGGLKFQSSVILFLTYSTNSWTWELLTSVEQYA
jgi:hypothetical protein